MLGDGRDTGLTEGWVKVLPQPPGKKVVKRDEFLFARETGNPLAIETQLRNPPP